MVVTQYNKVLLIGAGGFGRELFNYLNNSKPNSNNFEFLDDDLEALNGYENYPPIIGNLEQLTFAKNTDFIFSIINVSLKENLFKIIDSNKVIGFIHDSALIGFNTKINKSVIVFPNSIISNDSIVEKGVFINSGSQIGHDVKIGAYSSIMANVDIGGNSTIGKKVTIGSGATIIPGTSIVEETIIGAGSVVIKSIKKPGTYFGNPAKRIF